MFNALIKTTSGICTCNLGTQEYQQIVHTAKKRCVYVAKFNAHTNSLFIFASTLKFHELVKLNTVKIIHSCLHSEIPKGLEKMLKKLGVGLVVLMKLP